MFGNLFRNRRSAGTHAEFSGAPPQPETPISVIGDIHGQISCLEKMLTFLDREMPTTRRIFVGDYIDRGDHSADVLSCLRELEQQRPDSIFLMGNHEEMMLDFLDHPVKAGSRWLQFGGLQTMASFGLSDLCQSTDERTLRHMQQALRDAMPDGLEAWLRRLRRMWHEGNIAVVHAGADPARPIAAQPARALTWGHPDFGKRPRQDGIWVVRGHRVVTTPTIQAGVISVDTGAFANGKLTAATIQDCRTEFFQVTNT
ncbi:MULTISPECIES: metallophosphoesterase [unclassified Aliiroseovarius]|uniref:metallophosphoesterase n=1 Tax=unclassified Aliiroseovarius TaxID=2623558 RepID=UPI001568B378|nr:MULTISPECIES: metallophosphoesterase [unclassified Aliiroseovarius]NRP13430.1 Bis(5'-nucleosyl)-tetraphosphatase, symmetrical [Aliiroseovarius sp. xm-d-517]NRP40095.1 Bis(5'-nucleosyl)-tetraphosphatase, symmetrical [Aliiroseovarius sp. xm-m-339-2]NRP61101.1 Bis(5'-nucleosyl)-tetraphosphatase, symmetrical [Aliiroseovarius sp. xm-a-151]